MVPRQKITTFLWFNTEAEEAANYYVSLFKDAAILEVMRNGDHGPGPKGTALTVRFQLAGQQYIALNGGPHFKFNEAISLSVDCESQQEVDHYWNELTDGGEESMCGWLKDRYGLSWQIVPAALVRMMSDRDGTKVGRMVGAMMKMKKLDIATLERAFAGE